MELKIGQQQNQAAELTHQQKLDKIEKAYSSEPWWYDVRGFFILKLAYRSGLIEQVRLFSNNMSSKHLEVAVGTGTLFSMILKWRNFWGDPKCDITAFDYAPRMLAGAIRRFRNNQEVKLELGDVTALQYESQSFESVNIANAIHCFPDVRSAFSEVNRVLKKQGTFAGNVLLYPKGQSLMDQISRAINIWGIQKGILFTPYKQQEVEQLLYETGFQTIETKVSGNCLYFIAKKV